MKMTKLYTTVFDEELKSRGFKRKARLFYRLNGEILQGVVIKPINPYSIHFYFAPYWMENFEENWFPLNKGYWAENGPQISPSYAYYREENEQFNIDHMNICFKLAQNHILPILERVNSFESYIENCTPNWSNLGHKSFDTTIEVDPADIDQKYSYIKFPVNMHWTNWNIFTYSAFLKYACIVGDLQKGYDLLEEKGSLMPPSWNSKEFAQSEYLKFMTDDGLKRAEQYFEERRKIMLPRLRDELGLDTFNL